MQATSPALGVAIALNEGKPILKIVPVILAVIGVAVILDIILAGLALKLDGSPWKPVSASLKSLSEGVH